MIDSGHRLVQADAGTGKTYSLAARYLGLIGAGVEPSRILAVTFTRKAAAEILERILRRLATACVDEEEAGRLSAELGRRLSRAEIEGWLATVVAQLHRLAVSTLDGFFHRVVRCFRFELGLYRIASIASPDDRSLLELRHRALEATLDELADEDLDALVELLGRFYRGEAARSVAATLDRVLLELYERFRDRPEEEAWTRLVVPPGRLGAEDLLGAIDRLAGYGARCRTPALYRAIVKDVGQAQEGDWRAFVEDGLGKALAQDPPKRTYRQKEIPGVLVELYRPLVAHAGADLLATLARQTEASHRLLEVFDRHFERARRASGVLLFGDLVAKLARELPGLGDELLLELYYRLDARVQHLLLDEFQDTSSEQWQALLPLVDEVLAHGDGSRSLFVVGDPKQAIYGWRGGCAELFDDLDARFARNELTVASLRRSYRSSPVVLAAVNGVFSRISECPALSQPVTLHLAVERWQSRFAEHLAVDVERQGYVRLETSSTWEGEFREVDLEAEADESASEEPLRPLGHLGFAADRVAGITARRGSTSVAVLVQTNRTVAEVLDRLRERGIEASGEGGSPIIDDPAVLVILSALTLADHPHDSVALHHVTTSPLGPSLVREAATESSSELSRSIRRTLARRGLAGTLSRWARRLAPFGDQRGAIRLAQLIELADLKGDACERPGDFVGLVEGIRLDEPLPSGVRVMTVHKAKGLEFEVVVLCELERRLGDLNNPLAEVTRLHRAGPVDAVYRGTNATVRQFSRELQLAHQQEIERRVADDLSVLYVAMTRARSELHLVIQPLKRKSSGAPVSGQRTAASVLRWGLARELSPEDYAGGSRVLFELGQPRTVVQDRSASEGLGATAERPSRSGQTVPPRRPQTRRRRLVSATSPSALAAGTVLARDLMRLEDGGERIRGRLFHLWLEQLGWLEDGWPERSLLRGVAERSGLSVSDSWREHLLDELEELVTAGAIAELFRRPRSLPAEQVILWRERAYAVEVDGRVERGVLDRVVLYRSGRIDLGAELIDFKSDRLLPGEREEAISRYRPQMEAYRRALAQLLGVLPTVVRCRLALLSAGRVIEV